MKDIAILYEQAEKAIIEGAAEGPKNGEDSEVIYRDRSGFWNRILDMIRRVLALIGITTTGDDYDSIFISDPVNVCTGNYISSVTEIKFSGTPALSFVRYYNSLYPGKGSMGIGWTHNLEITLSKEDDHIDVAYGDKGTERFSETGDGVFISRHNRFSCVVEGDGYTLYKHDGDTYHFDAQGQIVMLSARNGRKLFFEHGEEKLRRAFDEAGRSLYYSYDENGLLSSVSDSAGRRVGLSYNNDLLVQAVSADGRKKTYAYDEDLRLAKITNNAGICVIRNEFDDENRVIRQDFPDGTGMTFTYKDPDVIVTDRSGAVTTYRHNERFQITDEIRPDGTQHYSYEDNLRTAYTDAAGGVFSRVYDTDGNVISMTDAMGRSVTLRYEQKGLPSVITERNGGTSRRDYDSFGNVVRYEDALGNETLFSYDSGSLTKIVQPDGSFVRFAYDEKGYLTARTDEMNNTTSFSYDDAGRLISHTDPRGMQYTFTYDPCDRLLSVKDPLGQMRTYEYSLTGRIEKITDFDGFTETFEYNELDLCSMRTDKGGRVTSYLYDPNGNLSEIILPNGSCILNEYDGYNRRTATVNELGLRTEFAYDGNSRLVRKSDGRLVTTIEYDLCGRAVRVCETAAGEEHAAHEKHVLRDAAGKVTQFTRPDGSVITYSYDLLGRCTGRTDPSGAVTAYAYDSRGRLISISREGRKLRHYSYYPNGKLHEMKDSGGNTVRYEYDAAGNRTKIIYDTGYEISFEYDALNRRIRMTDTSGRKASYTYDKGGHITEHTDALGNSSKYMYSPAGRITQAEDALGNTVIYEYDEMDHLVGITQGEETSEWGSDIFEEGSDARSISFERNARGLITGIYDAEGHSSSFAYNAYGEMILRITPENVQTGYEYDAFGNNTGICFGDGRKVRKSYNIMGLLTGMEDWNGHSEVSYDRLGRIASVSDAEGRKISYEWDAFNAKTAMHYPDGTAVYYDADDQGRLSRIRTGYGAFEYDYDGSGRLVRKSSANGTAEYEYCKDGRVKRLVYSDRDGKASEQRFTYDLRGNIHEKNELSREAGMIRTVYEYDALNRISRVSENGKTVRLYSYDAFGNRILTEENGKKTKAVYNRLNQLIRKEVSGNTGKTVTTWEYNEAGHAVTQKTEVRDAAAGNSGSFIRFRYDSADMLSGTESSDGTGSVYEYDGFGRRRSRTSYGIQSAGTKGHSPDGQKTLFWYDCTAPHTPLIASYNGSSFSDYVRDGELTGLIQNGKLGTYFCDPQGSVRAYCPGSGEKAHTYRYDEYGKPISNEINGIPGQTQPFGFAGMQRDAGTGMYLTHRRMYSPSIGRFMMKDEERYIHLQDPQTVNLYEYCLNNPVMYADPDGNDCYYFYLPEWEDEALTDQQLLAERYGYGIDQVHLIPITNDRELTDGWNAMGTENGQPVDIDTVVINTHANPYVLGYGNNSNDQFSVNDAYALDNKSMDELILYGCNAGHRDYADENIANAFSHRTNNAPVMASDGTVYGQYSDDTYVPTNDEEFQYWAEQAGNGGRDNEGWQVYQQVDGRTVVTNTGVDKATVITMLRLISNNRIKGLRE
ncbi:MAG: DUF6531 domain-containing protein [Solobacterium sp.]|nr:DUF6531 domain-containing protein [Solobacterium sp.]